MMQLLRHIHGKDKASGFMQQFENHLASEEGDIVTRSIVTCKNGEARKAPPPPPMLGKTSKKEVTTFKKVETPFKDALSNMVVLSVVFFLLMEIGSGTPVSVLRPFLLAGAAGYQAVWGVAHALHTPLMSVTNAISGMTLVGGLLLLHEAEESGDEGVGVWILAMIAVLFSTSNIVGGFIVSQRMLNLFKRGGEKDYSPMMLVPGIVPVSAAVFYAKDPQEVGAVNTISALLCVAAIGGLASMSTANMGCKFGIIGVAGCLAATFATLDHHLYAAVAGFMGVGAIIGVVVGLRVSPIALPQTVAAFHSLVGLAAMCTSIGSFANNPEVGINVKTVSSILGDFIGGVTFTGSIIAFGKLNGNLKSTALSLPGKNLLNLSCLLFFFGLIYLFLTTSDT